MSFSLFSARNIVLMFILIIQLNIAVRVPSGIERLISNKAVMILPSLLSAAMLMSPIAAEANSLNGGKLFAASCAGCHGGGGNIIPFSGSKTLQSSALKENGYDSVEKIASIIKSGKGAMMSFGEFTSSKGNIIPARFTDTEMTDIGEFVLEQAESGWK
eukprot:gene4242-8436_t